MKKYNVILDTENVPEFLLSQKIYGLSTAKSKYRVSKDYSTIGAASQDINVHVSKNPRCGSKFARKVREVMMERVAAGRKNEYWEFPHSKEGFDRYLVKSVPGNQLLGFFWGTRNGLSGDWFDLHLVSWRYMGMWYGCLGANIDPKSKEVNFECCDGTKSIAWRYTKYKLIKL